MLSAFFCEDFCFQFFGNASPRKASNAFLVRFLHLNRRTRLHARQVFKEEEEAIKVNLHEGCGRTKLFWLTAAADSATLKVR